MDLLLKKADKSGLLSLIEKYDNLDESKYTTESFNEYKSTLELAIALLNNDDVTQNEVNEMIELLMDKYNSLKENIKDEDKEDGETSKPGDDSNNEVVGPGNGTTGDSNNDNIDNEVVVNPDSSNNNSTVLPETGDVFAPMLILLLSITCIWVGNLLLRRNGEIL